MITAGKREREKARKEKQAQKLAKLQQNAADRYEGKAWPPSPGRALNWPEDRTQAVIDELVPMLGARPNGTLCNHMRNIASNPADLSGYRALGQELLIDGKVDEALGVFNVVMREFPQQPMGAWKYAVCLRTRGDMEGFREWMHRAWRRSQELPRAIDGNERDEFERDAALAGLKVG
ncbi:MAG: tetratricopeptide repeat protein [Candidatus Xenobia bacterium]